MAKNTLRITLGLLLTLSVASYALTPLSFISTPRLPVSVNAGGQATVYYTLQNNTPVNLPLSISVSTERGQLNVPADNPCGTQLAGNRRCTLPLTFQAPPIPNQSIQGQLTIDYGTREKPLNATLKLQTKPQGRIVYIHDGQPITQLEGLTISDSGTISVTNEGTGALQALSVKIPPELSGFTNNCQGTNTLKPKQSCSITYTQPRSSARDAAWINAYASNTKQSPVELSIKMKGRIAYIHDGQPITQLEGLTISDSGTISVTNEGAGTLQALSVKIPPTLSGFTNNCQGTDTLKPQQSCSITYKHPRSSTRNAISINTYADNTEQNPVGLSIKIKRAAGKAMCWGRNDAGQLGDSTTTKRRVPVNVSNLGSNVMAIAGGLKHTCALLDSSAVKCWGSNAVGQLGSTAGNPSSELPVDVLGLGAGSGVTSITAGGNHSCALLDSGAVKCWGWNSLGQLGTGDNADRNQPEDVPGLGAGSGVIAITAGNAHTCALLQSGAVKCWGLNAAGQLGNGQPDNSNHPVDVSSLGAGSGVIAIAAGDDHTCALLDSGAVKCWGMNTAGQLGNGAAGPPSIVPVDVEGLGPPSAVAGARAITAGSNHTCALLTSDAVKCWGQNTFGQLGTGDNGNRPKPGGNVLGLGPDSGVIEITAGFLHTCALLNTGAMKCWGYNLYGQLGNASNIPFSSMPVNVSNVSIGLAVFDHNRGNHSCAIIKELALPISGHE